MIPGIPTEGTAWMVLKAHMEKKLQSWREELEFPVLPDWKTPILRGQIDAYKTLIAAVESHPVHRAEPAQKETGGVTGDY